MTESEADDICHAAADTVDGMVELYSAQPVRALTEVTLAAV